MEGVDAALHTYSRAVEHQLGTGGTTSTSELLRYGREHFSPAQFLGVYPAGQVPDTRPKHRAFYIVNTSSEAGADAHWMSVGMEHRRKDLLFDSFGRTPRAGWQPHLRHMNTTDPDVNQKPDTLRCGQLSLAWDHIFLAYGYDVAALA